MSIVFAKKQMKGFPVLLPTQAEVSAPERIRQVGALRVGTAGDYQPMSFLDPEPGTYVGFDAELAEDLAASLGATGVIWSGRSNT